MAINKQAEMVAVPLEGIVEGYLRRAGREVEVPMPRVGPSWRYLLATPLLMAADMLGFALSIALAYLVRELASATVLALPAVTVMQVITNLWWVPLLGTLYLFFEKSYVKRLSFWQEAGEIVKVSTLVFLVAISIVFLAKLGDATSRSLVVLAWMASLFTVPAFRYMGKLTLIRLHIWEKPVLIVGAGETGHLILNALHRESTLGYRPMGFLEDEEAKRLHPPTLPNGQAVPVLGGFDEAEEIMDRTGIHNVIVAVPGLEGKKLVRLVNRLQRKADNLIVVPDLFGMAMEGVKAQYLFNEKTLVLKIRNNLNNRFNLCVKRISDLTISLILLPLMLPLMLVIAGALKMDSKGPVIFKNRRIGRKGQEFDCYKFRSMHARADDILWEYLSSRPDLKWEWETYAKLRGYDPRVTRVGAFLRKLSLDELPQIINVIKGDMSLVGPRPYLPRERERMQGREDILVTRPGMTGFWQVSGRNEIEFDERLRMDTWYVRNWSLWYDIILLMRTAIVVIKGKGAH